MKRVSEQIADWLIQNNVTQCFTVTGGGSMFLNVDIGSNAKINTVFMHHEQACAMAAEGYARITNKPAIVLTTTGPGAINALNGVYGAFTDSIPMLVISGQVKSDTCMDFVPNFLLNLRQLGDQEGPTVALAKKLTKYSILIRKPTDLEIELPKALSMAISGRPGPVWLDIPIDIQNSTEQLIFRSLDVNVPDNRLDEELNLVIEKLQKANKPLILAGTGVRLSGATDSLRKLIEQYNIPLATAWTHDIIESDHPLFVGRPGTIGTRAGNFCLQAADLVIVIGSRLNIRQTGYNFKDFAKNAYIIQVDIDISELIKKTTRIDSKVISDAKLFIDKLNLKLQQTTLPRYEQWIKWCKDVNEKFNIVKEHTQQSTKDLNPYVAVKTIFDYIKDDDVIVCGNASACILPFQIGKLKQQNRMFSNSGSASMGYDLPAALGAACATSSRIICFAGDGSIMMNIQELQTLKTLQKNVIIFLINNNGYLSIKQTHENFFGKIIGATPQTGVEFPDFKLLSESFGLKFFQIDINNLQCIKDILNETGPILVNLIVDPAQGFAPRMKAKLDQNGKFLPLQLDDMFPYIDEQLLTNIRNSALSITSTIK
jgi:acetolactate synthase-1/2/3 large subunit